MGHVFCLADFHVRFRALEATRCLHQVDSSQDNRQVSRNLPDNELLGSRSCLRLQLRVKAFKREGNPCPVDLRCCAKNLFVSNFNYRKEDFKNRMCKSVKRKTQ